MTVYVDDMYAPFQLMKMCHMIADDHDELMRMASKIGMSPVWIQDEGTPQEHFDVSIGMRRRAVLFGAVEVSMIELAHMTIERRPIDE